MSKKIALPKRGLEISSAYSLIVICETNKTNHNIYSKFF